MVLGSVASNRTDQDGSTMAHPRSFGRHCPVPSISRSTTFATQADLFVKRPRPATTRTSRDRHADGALQPVKKTVEYLARKPDTALETDEIATTMMGNSVVVLAQATKGIS